MIGFPFLRTRHRVWAGLLMTAIVLSTPARVFWTHDAIHGPTAAGQPGWNRAYSTQIRLNDGRASLDVIGCQLPASEAERMLVDTYRASGAPVLAGHGWELAWGIAEIHSMVVRWLIFSLGSPRECLVVRITQSKEDFLDSARPPPRSRLTQLTEVPNSTVRWYAADEQARVGLEVLEAATPPDPMRWRVVSDLIATGWVPTLPDGGDDYHPVMFRRGRELCLIHVAAGDAQGSRILRVYKELGRTGTP
jgi:hypothetical protein